MTFIPGHYYYVLSADEYALLAELMEDYEGASFLGDFSQSDGSYYADAGSIDAGEAGFLADWGLSNCLAYILSTQSTHFVG